MTLQVNYVVTTIQLPVTNTIVQFKLTSRKSYYLYVFVCVAPTDSVCRTILNTVDKYGQTACCV